MSHVITEVLTQGRFANGEGQEYAQAYRIQYWRQGWTPGAFKDYRDNIGQTVRYIGGPKGSPTFVGL